MTTMMMMTRLMTNRKIKTHPEHHADKIFETSIRLLADSTRFVQCHHHDASSASSAVIRISM